jgi:hypothetical protein
MKKEFYKFRFLNYRIARIFLWIFSIFWRKGIIFDRIDGISEWNSTTVDNYYLIRLRK